jgi:hypothetical protein
MLSSWLKVLLMLTLALDMMMGIGKFTRRRQRTKGEAVLRNNGPLLQPTILILEHGGMLIWLKRQVGAIKVELDEVLETPGSNKMLTI